MFASGPSSAGLFAAVPGIGLLCLPKGGPGRNTSKQSAEYQERAVPRLIWLACSAGTIGNFAHSMLAFEQGVEPRPPREPSHLAPPLSRVAEHDFGRSNDGQNSCQVDGRIT